jgi:hypothetical protein
MRDQYAGDISDVLKFAFLRALAADDKTLGIAWYYAPDNDGRADGRHLEWQDEAAWRLLDAQLHAGLSALPERSVAALERAAIWPKGALFHREPMPQRLRRSAWAARKRAAFEDADLVFLDPDNGLGAETEKHATYDEIRLLRRPGRAVVFITFPPHAPHEALLRKLHERLRAEAGAGSAVTLKTSVSLPRAPGSHFVVPRQRWFTVVDPDAALVARARAFALALSSIPRVRTTLETMSPMTEALSSGTQGARLSPSSQNKQDDREARRRRFLYQEGELEEVEPTQVRNGSKQDLHFDHTIPGRQRRTTKWKIGDLNRNGQRLLAITDRPGNDHAQYVWIVECTVRDQVGRPCGHRYGVNGSDFFQRKCPVCQGGRTGLPIEGLV